MKGYKRRDKARRKVHTRPSSPKDTGGLSSNPIRQKMGLGILLKGNVALTLLVTLLNLQASQVFSEKNCTQNAIRSCPGKCTPCMSAKDSRTANLTLDPATNYPHLYISADLKSVSWKARKQHLSSDPLRFNVLPSVLSNESFASGKMCWEVEVLNGGTWWGVGVVRESVNRNGPIFLAPDGGYWGVQLIKGQYQSITNPRTNLTLCHNPTRIRVSLDYSEGQIAFFDGDTDAELFSFPKTNFGGEKLRAWFLIDGFNGELRVYP